MNIIKYNFEDVTRDFKNRGYILLSKESDYKNSLSKMKYICPKHQNKGIQAISYSHFHQGEGCYYCGREKTVAGRKAVLTYDEDRLLAESKGFIYIESHITNHKYYIDFICRKHMLLGVQNMTRSNMQRDIKGCQYCARKNLPFWYIKNQINQISPEIILDNSVSKLTVPINAYCTIHDIDFQTTLQLLLKGKKCPYCSSQIRRDKNKLTENIILNNVHLLNPHIDVVQYKGAICSDSVWKCNIHDKVFNKCYTTLLTSKSGCPLCYKENIMNRIGITESEFLGRLMQKHPSVEMKSFYDRYDVPTQFYCNEHDCTFTMSPRQLLLRNRCCYYCYKSNEEKMCFILESKGYKITRQKIFEDCSDIRQLKFDCYLDDYNVIFEYDGEQHYYPVFGDKISTFQYTQSHDRIKNEYCKANHIPIIRIPYYEADNMESFIDIKLKELQI